MSIGFNQAGNQVGTPGGAKCFLKGAQIFQTMSNAFKLYVQHIFPGEGENFLGVLSSPAPPGYGPGFNSRNI